MPIVEPEVLMDGDHTIERCVRRDAPHARRACSTRSPHQVSARGHAAQAEHGHLRQGEHEQASVEEVAERRCACFKRTVPAAVPGIVFLSGGQSDELATAHLDAMNRSAPLPWQLSFSYGRALQAASLKAWTGKPANVGAAQKAFHHRAKCNGAARYGRYSRSMESDR